MPASGDILLGLTRAANGAVVVSIAWHIVLAAIVAALLMGFRPQRHLAATALSAPLASVAVVAFAFDNPFNGAVFSLLSAMLAVLALRATHEKAAFRSGWSAAVGSSLVLFGAVYPHFLTGASALTYLWAAPLGAIPCPTLSVVIGLALLGGGFGLGAWRLTLVAAGLFYAVFGVLRLGVQIDYFLLLGATGLLIQYGKDRFDLRTGEQSPPRKRAQWPNSGLQQVAKGIDGSVLPPRRHSGLSHPHRSRGRRIQTDLFARIRIRGS